MKDILLLLLILFGLMFALDYFDIVSASTVTNWIKDSYVSFKSFIKNYI